MQTSAEPAPARPGRLAAVRGHAGAHAVPVLLLGGATVLGALAAFVYQALSARALGPADQGMLYAFLAILNVPAFASSALQNSVAVRTAEITSDASGATPRRARVSEATVLGLGGGLLVAAATPLLVHALDTTASVVLVAAAFVPLSFWLAEAVGLLQGAGRPVAAVGWTTVSLVARVALLLVVVGLGLGVAWVLAAALVATGVAVVGARLGTRRVPHPGHVVRSRNGLVVLALSLLSAWLVNADVILLRATADETLTGNFGSAAVLVKAAFMLPATLSVYLLSRFVRNRDNADLVRLGSRVTVGLTVVAGVVMVAVFAVAGDPVGRLVFGPKFDRVGDLLVLLSLAYLPWIVAQSLLIQLIAAASRPALVVAAVATVVQAVGLLLVTPDVHAFLAVQAGAGVAVLAAFLVIVGRAGRARPEPAEQT